MAPSPDHGTGRSEPAGGFRSRSGPPVRMFRRRNVKTLFQVRHQIAATATQTLTMLSPNMSSESAAAVPETKAGFWAADQQALNSA